MDNSDTDLHHNEIEKQRKELLASIQYAAKIQKALFPKKDFLQKVIPDYFVLLKPKAVVSGDFYWVNRRIHTLYIAAADCTGHGIPGAFMSVLGISFLNEIIGKFQLAHANEILDQLREHIMSSLGQRGELMETKDGMDIALCMIDMKTLTMEYAGANSPVYVIKDGQFIELSPDKMPIGIHGIDEKSFTNHEIQLQPGDAVYLFTDGFADQFGGPKNKKFKYVAFRNMIEKHAQKSMKDQKSIYNQIFTEWKEDEEQIDDLLLMGCRF